jgi:hypothetical protein
MESNQDSKSKKTNDDAEEGHARKKRKAEPQETPTQVPMSCFVVQGLQESSDYPSLCKSCEVLRVRAPSMEEFFTRYMKSFVPVIVTNAMDHWPAMNEHSWADLQYLKVRRTST